MDDAYFNQYGVKISKNTIETSFGVINTSDIAGAKIVQSRAKQEELNTAPENSFLLPIVSILSWAGVIFINPILGKLFLLPIAVGASIGWITFQIAQNKHRTYNHNTPIYNQIHIYFKSRREVEIIDFFEIIQENYVKNNLHKPKGFFNRIVNKELSWIVTASQNQIQSIINSNNKIVNDILNEIKRTIG